MTDDLDRLLNKRMTPQAPSNLAHRIAEMAGQKPARRPLNIWDEISAMFIIPRPAVALGFSILLGLFVGFQAGDVSSTEVDWASSLYVDEGGWL